MCQTSVTNGTWCRGSGERIFVSGYIIWGELTGFVFFFFFNFLLHGMVCRNLAPQPGSQPKPLALEVQSLNHWIAGESQGELVKELAPP